MGFIPAADSWFSVGDRGVVVPKRKCYLYISKENKVVGLCLADEISEAYPLVVSSKLPTTVTQEINDRNNNPSSPFDGASSLERSNVACPASLGIYQIWCHGTYRRRGISRTLVDAARSFAFFGACVPLSRVAFSSPTAEGLCFARSYCGTASVLVYDC